MTEATPAKDAAFTRAQETIRDALMDGQYLAGMKAGWNAAQADDPEAAYARLSAARAGHMAGYKAAKEVLLQAPPLTDDTRNHPIADMTDPMPVESIDGLDLLAGDLDAMFGVQEYNLHDGGEPTRMLVYLTDGRRFMLTAEEQGA